jgi:hypothetical protein
MTISTQKEKKRKSSKCDDFGTLFPTKNNPQKYFGRMDFSSNLLKQLTINGPFPWTRKLATSSNNVSFGEEIINIVYWMSTHL